MVYKCYTVPNVMLFRVLLIPLNVIDGERASCAKNFHVSINIVCFHYGKFKTE